MLGLRFQKRRKTNGAQQPLSSEERRFARGTRTLADLLAPAAVEVARNHVRLEYQYARVLAVVGYPRTVAAGWLTPLLEFEHPIDISVHVHPLETAGIVKLLSHKLVQLQSSRLVEVRGGRLADPEREVAFEDAERLRDALQRGEQRVFSVSLYVLLRASSPRGLDDLTRRVETTLDGMLAHSRVAILEQERSFRACLPTARDELLAYRNLDTTSLATTFPFTSGSLSMERGVLYGVATRSKSPVIVDPFDASLENANLLACSLSTKGMLAVASQRGSWVFGCTVTRRSSASSALRFSAYGMSSTAPRSSTSHACTSSTRRCASSQPCRRSSTRARSS